jgi:cytochrome c oxidase subunit 2
METAGVPFFPEQASTVAPAVDGVYIFASAVAAFFTALIFVLIVFLALYYRKGAVRDRSPKHGGAWILETTWIVIPFVIVMVLFFWGAVVFVKAQQSPPNALEVQVIGKQWMWKIQHPQGRREINTLHVPRGTPVRLRMISEDVIHSFFIPAFRVKRDVLPGRYGQLWFEATRPGVYHLYCAEYCGTDHADMRGSVIVMEPSEYAAWVAASEELVPQVAGGRLFEQLRCNTCHHGGEDARGPDLRRAFGRSVELEGGGSDVVDAGYIRESILRPQAKIHVGYEPIMPTFENQLDEEQIFLLVEYIRSLATEYSGEELEKE